MICPELSAGFSTPRPPAEIADCASGTDVLEGRGRVVEATGRDVTDLYIAGAQSALRLARERGCKFALLVDGSPSCGSGFIHDGSFSGRRHVGTGVTAALLRQYGIEVFSEGEIERPEMRIAETDGQLDLRQAPATITNGK